MAQCLQVMQTSTNGDFSLKCMYVFKTPYLELANNNESAMVDHKIELKTIGEPYLSAYFWFCK